MYTIPHHSYVHGLAAHETRVLHSLTLFQPLTVPTSKSALNILCTVEMHTSGRYKERHAHTSRRSEDRKSSPIDTMQSGRYLTERLGIKSSVAETVYYSNASLSSFQMTSASSNTMDLAASSASVTESRFTSSSSLAFSSSLRPTSLSLTMASSTIPPQTTSTSLTPISSSAEPSSSLQRVTVSSTHSASRSHTSTVTSLSSAPPMEAVEDSTWMHRDIRWIVPVIVVASVIFLILLAVSFRAWRKHSVKSAIARQCRCALIGLILSAYHEPCLQYLVQDARSHRQLSPSQLHHIPRRGELHSRNPAVMRTTKNHILHSLDLPLPHHRSQWPSSRSIPLHQVDRASRQCTTSRARTPLMKAGSKRQTYPNQQPQMTTAM